MLNEAMANECAIKALADIFDFAYDVELDKDSAKYELATMVYGANGVLDMLSQIKVALRTDGEEMSDNKSTEEICS